MEPNQTQPQKETAVEIPAKFKSLVESIEKMSVIDLNELVKLLEKKFGVSAAAVASAAPAVEPLLPLTQEVSSMSISLPPASKRSPSSKPSRKSSVSD